MEGHSQVAFTKSLINNVSQGCGNQARINQYYRRIHILRKQKETVGGEFLI